MQSMQRDKIIFYAVTTVVSYVALSFGLRRLDPNRQASKEAKLRKKEIAARLGRSIQTNTYEDVIACDVVNPNHIQVNFDAIGGLEDVKKSLYELAILPLQRPELFARGKLLKPVKGVLLYGPPGTGKTMLAKAIAKEANACFINVRSATLQSKWFGDAQKLVTAVFTLAWKLQPSIIFIDEIDSMLGRRSNQEHEIVTNMKTEFMQMWDGFITDENARVMVLAATNRPWEVDEAILRRLPQTFEVPLPNAVQRESILRVILEDGHCHPSLSRKGPDSPIAIVAEKTEGYSGSDLQELCKKAAYRPIRELLEIERTDQRRGKSGIHTEPRALTFEDLLNTIPEQGPSGDDAFRYQQKESFRHSTRLGATQDDFWSTAIAQIMKSVSESNGKSPDKK
eukprot:jgi/Pico_ML_1/55538/g1210.t1